MNRRQKIIQQQFLDDEEEVIKRLETVYGQALKDIEKKAQELQDEINRLGTMANHATDAEEKAKFLSMQQSKIYQKQYQDAMKKQIGSILDGLHVEEFKTVSAYLTKCYEEGFIGTMFDLQGQGIPLCFPLDQEAMVRAVQLDSKISEGLYSRIGENVSDLKKKITAEVSRGIANGSSFHEVARQLRNHMIGSYDKVGGALYRSELIARTEGHRIQVQSAMDACYKAKEKGADVVKQWDATLDDSTRESHQAVDGEIRELDEPFSNGLMFPGDPSGGAAEVCNCRCALLQRARWALDEDELKVLQDRASFYGLDKADTFDEYKKKYLKAAEHIERQGKFIPATTIEEAQEYAQRFVSPNKSRYSGIVDYGKIDVSVANEINRTIFSIFEAYDVPPLRNIQLMNMREKRFREAKAEAAYGWGTGELFINGKWYKSAKTIAEHKKEYEDLLGRVLPSVPAHIEELSKQSGYTASEKHRYFSALLKSGRTNVYGVEVEGTIIHEMGHMLDYELFGLQKRNSPFDIKASMEKYADGISAYATTSSAEYVAESFAAYWKGELDILDPELVAIFERMRKK